MENDYEKKKKTVLDFHKEAFCVDGEARFVRPENYEVEAAIELTDSKRGTFVIGLLKEHPL